MAQIKTRIEIAHIKKACKITDKIFKKIVSKPGLDTMTEIELARFIKSEITKRRLRKAFPPIVTSGPRAGNSIHPKPTSEKLKGFVIIDFGVRVHGYCSDMTRTVFVGDPTKKDRELYALVLKAKQRGERATKPGVKCAAADAAARKTLGAYKKYFIHTLGHGVGRRIHELPRMYHKREKDIFKEGMAITIEPGIYVQNTLGIRIEDTYYLRKNGPKALTRSPTKLLIFPRK